MSVPTAEGTPAEVARPSHRRPRRPATVERTVRWLTLLTTVAANLVGGTIVFVLLVWVIPRPAQTTAPSIPVVLAMTCSYVLLSLVACGRMAMRRSLPGRQWLHDDRPPTPEEQRSLLRSPLYVLLATGSGWLGGALVFGTFSAVVTGWQFGITVAVTILLGGMATAVVGYLVTERVLRPAASLAIAARPLDRPALPGVTYRVLVAWAVGSGIPLLGVGLASLSTLTQRDFTRDQLAVFGLALAAIALFVGFLAIIVAARVTAAPLNAVRRAMQDVEAGDFSRRVDVHDGTEVGMLQSGFNRMVEGLAERERIRDEFGRHVGVDVAARALRDGTDFDGQQREAAVLFVDVIGSTRLARQRPAAEVVALLNAYFEQVVEVAHEHGGLVNKFQGDGAMVVFGAPTHLDDPAGSALAAARSLADRLATHASSTPAAIGVSHGTVVAGNIGSDTRFEYTVIGDPVNEAARLTEVAKARPSRIAASAATVRAARADEAARWTVTDRTTLRGRDEPTEVAEPVG